MSEMFPFTYCAVLGCETGISSNPKNVSLHAIPTNPDLKKRWMIVLNRKCAEIDWNRSRICSLHFEDRFIRSFGDLQDNAIPTIFPTVVDISDNRRGFKTNNARSRPYPKTKVDRLLPTVSQQNLVNDIKNTMNLISVPDEYANCVDDNLQCNEDTTVEAQLWLLIKKQDELIKRLNQSLSQSKGEIETLQKDLNETKVAKKEMEQSLDSNMYTIKCLQEKHATLEEQIEILTAIEAR